MRPLLYVIMVLAWLGPAAALIFLYRPQFVPDHAGYNSCIAVHPARYCHITFINPDHGRP